VANRHERATPSEASLAAFFLFGNIPEPLTAWEGVREVPAGSLVVADTEAVHEPIAFFSLNEALRDARDERLPADPAGHVREALKASVGAHLVADVEVGIFLSSGLDSAALLGLAREDHGQMRAVTLGFEEFEGTPSDEVPLARDIARRYGARHVVSTVSEPGFRASWPAILESMDQPSIDGVNTWLVSRVAAEAGLKVVLSGLGGDELFGGYPSFSRVPRWARLLRGPAAIPGLGAVTRGVVGRLPIPGISPKAAGLVDYGASIGHLWFLQRGLFTPWELPALLGEERAHYALSRLDLDRYLAAAVSPDPGVPVGRIAALESSLYMRNQLLRDADWASMAHSLEVRFPLVDVRLLPQIAPILVGQQGRGNAKRLLGTAPRPPLCASAAARPKTGFSVPLGQWLTRLDNHDSWRRVPMLTTPSCPWARRWAYVVAECFGLLGL
jgi:asparagine synthase (glutamine-hydrolysing)